MDKKVKEWLKSQQKNLDRLDESNVYAGIVSPNFLTDPACALQLGFAILRDKPIFLLVEKNLTIPESLVKVAKIIERFDGKNPDPDMERASKAMAKFAKEYDGHGKME